MKRTMAIIILLCSSSAYATGPTLPPLPWEENCPAGQVMCGFLNLFCCPAGK